MLARTHVCMACMYACRHAHVCMYGNTVPRVQTQLSQSLTYDEWLIADWCRHPRCPSPPCPSYVVFTTPQLARLRCLPKKHPTKHTTREGNLKPAEERDVHKGSNLHSCNASSLRVHTAALKEANSSRNVSGDLASLGKLPPVQRPSAQAPSLFRLVDQTSDFCTPTHNPLLTKLPPPF